MRARERSVYLVAALAAVLVAVSSITQAIRQGSGEPVMSVGWLPAVIVAAWPGSYRRCLGRRSRRAG